MYVRSDPLASNSLAEASVSVHYCSIRCSNSVTCVKYFLFYTSTDLCFAAYKIMVYVYNRAREDGASE